MGSNAPRSLGLASPGTQDAAAAVAEPDEGALAGLVDPLELVPDESGVEELADVPEDSADDVSLVSFFAAGETPVDRLSVL